MDPKKLAAVEDTGDRDRLTKLLAAADPFASKPAGKRATVDAPKLAGREAAAKLLLLLSESCPPAATGSSWNRCGGAVHSDIILGVSVVPPLLAVPAGWDGL